MEEINTFVIIFFAAILSIVHFFSHRISTRIEKYHFQILSFSGGTLIALIFLIFLPEIISISGASYVYLLLLAGFSIFHLVEKYLYQHVTNKNRLLKELKELHAAGFFIDHLIKGFILVMTIELISSVGYLILIPVLLHTLSSSISLAHIDQKLKKRSTKIVLAIAPLLGAMIALLLATSETINVSIIALSLGMMLYIVSRDILPKEKKGYPSLYIIGLVFVAIVWAIITY